MELQSIQNKIYEIRGVRVMLDFDLAQLYKVETRALKQAVRRNIERFPDDFLLKLSSGEANYLIGMGRSQNVISKDYNIGSSEMFAFTELGVAMLSSVLRSETAIQMNIAIMRTFAQMRQLAMTSIGIKQLALENSEIRRLLDEFMQETEGKFDDVYLALSQLAIDSQLSDNKPRVPVGYKTGNK